MTAIALILDRSPFEVYSTMPDMPIMSQINATAVSCESDHTPEHHKTMLNGGYMSGNGAFSEFYVPMVRQSTIEYKEESAFNDCFKPMGENNICIRYMVKCRYCKNQTALKDAYPFLSSCLKTGIKMKHLGKPFIACDFWEPNSECIKKAQKGIAKNRIGIGGFVGLKVKR